jgi:predicted transcriptional regulator
MSFREEPRGRHGEQGSAIRTNVASIHSESSMNGEWSPMDRQECLDIITMLEKFRSPFEEMIPGAGQNAEWNILVFLIRNHLMGRPVKMSALESASKRPPTTAKRRIQYLIDRGAIEKTARNRHGRISYASPSKMLMDKFLDCIRRTKSLLPELIMLHPQGE